MSGGRSAPGGRALRLQLFVAGQSPNSAAAVRHLRAVLKSHPSLRVELEILDVLKYPEAGERARVLVTPMLIKLAPAPERRVYGTLKDTGALLSVLGLDEDRHE